MKKVRNKIAGFIMAAVVSATMIFPQVNVSASTLQPELVEKIQQKQYFPTKTEIQKNARKTEPEEWNKPEINVYKFGNVEDAAYYMLTGGTKYYNKNYFKNPEKIKLTIVESGTLFLGVAGDTGQAGYLYDSNQKLVKKLSAAYIKTDVKAGETYYVEFPRNCKEGTIAAYVLNTQCKSLKDDTINMQKGEGKSTYSTFTMKKRGTAVFMIVSLVEDGGKTSFKVQRKEKGTWKTIGKTGTIKYTKPVLEEYSLSKGAYRLVLNGGTKQINTIVYGKEYIAKKVAYSKSKAQKLDKDNIYTTTEHAARWYKYTVKSTKKTPKITIETIPNKGGFKFEVYRQGKKKAIKTIKTSEKHPDYTLKLPKRKTTYYIKVSKITKKTNGSYEISK